jgi:UDP-glucose 4-epimerase
MHEEHFAGKRVLVTGAAGFLGTHLCRRLADCGAAVFAASRVQTPELGNRVHWLQADLSDPAAAHEVHAEAAPEIVYQLCGHADASRERELVYPTLTSDVLTSVHLLMAAAERPVHRFIMTASLEEPESGGVPTSPYAAAKLASTSYGRMFQLLYQVPVVLIRPYMTYGPGQSERKIIPYLVRTLLDGRSPQLGDGDRLVDWIYVEDVVDGFLAAAMADGVEGMTFDLGSGTLISIRDMARTATRLTGASTEPRFGTAALRAHERMRVAVLDTTKNRLQWTPTTSLDQGLQKVVDFYRQRPSAGIIDS